VYGSEAWQRCGLARRSPWCLPCARRRSSVKTRDTPKRGVALDTRLILITLARHIAASIPAAVTPSVWLTAPRGRSAGAMIQQPSPAGRRPPGASRRAT